MAFVYKSVNPSGHFGRDLQELRERAGLSRGDVANYTKITESFVRALEEERWDDISDPVYSERILRSYVAFLGGKEKYFLNKYRAFLHEQQVQRKPEELLPRPRQIRLGDLTVGSRILAFIGFLLFVTALGGYIYFQVRTISAPPPLTIDEPQEGQRLNQPLVLVKGKTAPEASVTINGKQAVVQPDGTFSLALDVPRGTTVITVSARKRHGQEEVETRRVVYDQPLPAFYETTTSEIGNP